MTPAFARHAFTVAALAGLVAGCGSVNGGGGAPGAVNALIASFETEVAGDPETAESLSKSTATRAILEPNDVDDTVEVSWGDGPMSLMSRNFAPVEPGVFEPQDPNLNGSLLVTNPTDNTTLALVTVIPTDKTKGATGIIFDGTVPTNVPTSGMLTYTKTDGAIAQRVSGAGCPVDQIGCYGDVEVTANFGSGAVSGTLTNFDGDVEDIAFAGSMAEKKMFYSANSITYNGTKTNGQLYGGFYGPGATETAGAFDIGSGNARVVGGYGAAAPPPP